MAMDRGGTGTSQGSSSNQKGGSGEGSKSSSSGSSSKNQGSSANNRGSGSSSSASKGSSSSSSSSKGSSSSASAAGSSSSKASTSSSKSGSVGTGKASGNLAGGNGLAGGMSEADQRGAYSAGRAAAQAIGSGSAKASDGSLSAKGDQTGRGGVASRVSSINQTLSSYGAAPSTPNHNISSIGGPSMYGMNDGSLTSKVKGALGFGPSTNFNETIKTDNVNGVIGNLQRKAQEGALTARDKANIADASGAYNKQAGANIVGGTLLGGVGKTVAGLAGDVGNADSYFSGIGRDAANGDFDSSRLEGQRGTQLGSEGGLDSTLKAGVSLLSGLVPGAGLVMTGAVNGLTQPASGFGAALNQLNEQAGNTVNKGSGQIGNGSSKDYLAPPRQSLASTGQSEGSLAFDSSYYDPSRFNVTTGKRGY